MPRRIYDTIVIGAGGMGSAAICELARRGKRVLGLERFTIPHELGSSAGSTRIFRFAYFEDPSYVPLMRLSYDRWRALEREAGEPLLTTTGGLDIGLPSSRVVRGAKEACSLHDLEHDVLSAEQVTKRFPAWNLPSGFEAVFQPDAGIVLADRAIAAHVALARKLGAEVHEDEAVRSWQPANDHVKVTTNRAAYEAGSLILAAGAWSAALLPKLAGLAVPERQVVAWFHMGRPEFSRGPFPIFIIENPSDGVYYGFPELDADGLKLGKFHHRREAVDPDRIDRRVGEEDLAALKPLAQYLSVPLGPLVSHKTCMFVNSPDEHFILDVLPGQPNVIIAAGFSGHGFKFCSGIGEILADLATQGETRHDTHLFRLSRAALSGVI